jgi:hypothetical protein
MTRRMITNMIQAAIEKDRRHTDSLRCQSAARIG